MKAVILSAGQGKRLMPLTANNPKCLLDIEGKSLIEWQIDELYKGGIEQATVVAGYKADRVRQLLYSRYDSKRVCVLYNPTYAWADNLFSCWVARSEMDKDFVLLNGDTIFEWAVVCRLLSMPARPVTVVTHRKGDYDADDMKVVLDGDRLVRIGKDLAGARIDGESIGMILFRRQGAHMFRRAVERALRDPAARQKWYLAVINEMAQRHPIWTCSANGLRWCEVDFPADLKQAGRLASTWRAIEMKDVSQPAKQRTDVRRQRTDDRGPVFALRDWGFALRAATPQAAAASREQKSDDRGPRTPLRPSGFARQVESLFLE